MIQFSQEKVLLLHQLLIAAARMSLLPGLVWPAEK